MGNLSRDDQEQLEYIDAWYEQKEQRRLERLVKKKTRKYRLKTVCKHIGAAVAELVLIFKGK